MAAADILNFGQMAPVGCYFVPTHKAKSRNFSEVVTPSWILENLWFWSNFLLHGVILHRWESTHPWRKNSTLIKSNMAATANLNFVQMTFLVTWSNSGCRPKSYLHQSLAKSINPGRSCLFSPKPRWRRQPFWNCKWRHLKPPTLSIWQFHTCVKVSFE